MKKRIALFIALALALAPSFAEKTTPSAGSWGLTASAAYNAYTIGGIYHFTDVLAIRPFAGVNNENLALADVDDNDWGCVQFTFGTDALYELALADDLLLGLGGTVSFTKYYDSDQHSGTGVTNDRTTLTVGALARAQYFFSRHFAAYSDFGIGMTRVTNKYDDGTDYPSEKNYTTTAWKTTSCSLGVAYYVQ